MAIKRIRIGKSTITDIDNTAEAILGLTAARALAGMAAAEEFKQKLIEYQERQGFGTWPSLNSDYLAWKERHGRSTEIMRSKGNLIDAIEIRRRGTTFEVGWFDEKHPESDLSVGSLQAVHEFGTGDIPARPWLTPVADSGETEAAMMAAMMGVIDAALRGGR